MQACDVIVVHHAGGSSVFYSYWLKLLPAHMELRIIDLPGRGRKFGQPLLFDAQSAIDVVSTDLRSVITRPYYIVGHSMGAHLAYRALAGLPKSLQELCRQFIPSASIGPNALRNNGYGFRSLMSDQELWDYTVNQGGVNLELANNKSFMDFLLPTLRSDFRICESLLKFEDCPILNIPLKAFGGKDDNIAPSEVADWCRVSSKSNGYRLLPGKHFYFLGFESTFFELALTDDMERR